MSVIHGSGKKVVRIAWTHRSGGHTIALAEADDGDAHMLIFTSKWPGPHPTVGAMLERIGEHDARIVGHV